MKFVRLDLLTLLISLFIFNSCKNQDAVGLGVSVGNQINTHFTDTSTIVINTVPEDSVVTQAADGTAISSNCLAYFVDPIFGTTVSSIATDLNLPDEEAYTLPVGTVSIDSARFVMHYAPGFYGDSITSTYTVNIYQLQNKYNIDTVYYSNKNFGNYASSPLLGTLTFNARPHDSVKVYDIILGAPDTLEKAGPQIRIPVNTQFVNTYLFAASSNSLGTDAIFQNNIRGFYIAINRAKSTGAGGALMFTPKDSLNVYYRAVHGTTVDTGMVSLPVLHSSFSIQHTYPTTIQTELANQTTGSRNTFYLQGLAGLRAKVTFPNLLVNLRSQLLKNDSDILINRAELLICPVPGTNIPYTPIPKITMYQLDIASQRIELQDANAADPRYEGVLDFGGFYAPVLQQYHFIITAYLQDLLWGKQKNYGTYIAPSDTTNTTSVALEPASQMAARVICVGTNLAPADANYRIKLNIIYTKIRRQL
jgi:hypothetical protein